MHIGKLVFRFRFPGCQSLKEKRGRMRGLRDRFGKNPTLSVCEFGSVDSHQFADWAFVGCSSERALIDKNFSQIEAFVCSSMDVEIVEIKRSWI
jgi:hypothetical protein